MQCQSQLFHYKRHQQLSLHALPQFFSSPLKPDPSAGLIFQAHICVGFSCDNTVGDVSSNGLPWLHIIHSPICFKQNIVKIKLFAKEWSSKLLKFRPLTSVINKIRKWWINFKYDYYVVLVMKVLWVYWLKTLNFLIGLWNNNQENNKRMKWL